MSSLVHDDSITINPGMLESPHFKYTDLQRLAKRVGVNASGSRKRLVRRLQSYHRCVRVVCAHPVRAVMDGRAGEPARRARTGAPPRSQPPPPLHALERGASLAPRAASRVV